MTSQDLQCPDCHCPLTAPAGSATGMSCPRCKAWLEFDARCTGGCMSCFKKRESEPTSCCTTPADTVGVQIDQSPHQLSLQENGGDVPNLLAGGWKRLIQRLFAVR